MSDYERIKKIVEDKMDIKDISSRSRLAWNVKARYLYFKLCQEFLKHNFRQMACASVVDRNHEMVIHGIREFNNLIDTPFYSDIIEIYSSCVVALDIRNPKNEKYVLKRILELESELNMFKNNYIKNSKVQYETIEG